MKKKPLPSLEDVYIHTGITDKGYGLLFENGYEDVGILLKYTHTDFNDMRTDFGLGFPDMKRLEWWKLAREELDKPFVVDMTNIGKTSAMIGRVGGRTISGNNGIYSNNRKVYGNVILGDHYTGSGSTSITATTDGYAMIGNNMEIRTPHTTVIGKYNQIFKEAHHCTIIGDENFVAGPHAKVRGDKNKIRWQSHHTTVTGNNNAFTKTQHCTAVGTGNVFNGGHYNSNQESSGGGSATTVYGTTTYAGSHYEASGSGDRIVMNVGRLVTSDGDVLESHGNNMILTGTTIYDGDGFHASGNNYAAVSPSGGVPLSVQYSGAQINIHSFGGPLTISPNATNKTFDGICFTWIVNGKQHTIADMTRVPSINGIQIDVYKASILPQNVQKKDVVMKPAHYLDNILGITDTLWIEGTDEKEEECVICKDRLRKIVLKPCGHLHTCAICTRKIGKCPVCQAKIVDTNVVYK